MVDKFLGWTLNLYQLQLNPRKGKQHVGVGKGNVGKLLIALYTTGDFIKLFENSKVPAVMEVWLMFHVSIHLWWWSPYPEVVYLKLVEVNFVQLSFELSLKNGQLTFMLVFIFFSMKCFCMIQVNTTWYTIRPISKHIILNIGKELFFNQKSCCRFLTFFYSQFSSNYPSVIEMFTLLTYRSRQEYVELLLSDLCKYYSYGKFLMEKFMDLFPINEVTEL